MARKPFHQFESLRAFRNEDPVGVSIRRYYCQIQYFVWPVDFKLHHRQSFRTGFVRLDRATYQKQIADALVALRRVKAEFESSGYEVETVRLTTYPLP